LLKTADIVVLSSHYEGLSLASIEGMASGKPFIASDVPGLHEVVKGADLLFEDKTTNNWQSILYHF
jgi:glycosyltransferase involved in cell wall biosynthesis